MEAQNDQGHLMHYAFAHRHLPEMAFDEPHLILGAAVEGRLSGILNRIWRDMNASVPEANKRDGEIGVELKKLDDGVLILVLMPEPQIPPEAKFVALSFQESEDPQQILSKCFALELSYDNSYALGFWSADRTHGIISRLSGDLGEFLNAVKEIIGERS
jgi:hypothetical protein